MRDGTVLRADAWLPDSGEPVPAILSRTPYDRTLGLTPVAALDPERAVAAGFAMICQDVRGQHGSEGAFTPFESEGLDGHDSVEWVAAQDWCNGRVAMAGRSYAAATQWRAALEQPEHLAAIFPVVVGCDPYDGWLYSGGAFELGFNLFWVHLMADPKSRSSLDESYWHLPLVNPPLLEESPAGDVYREWLAHPAYDDHWRRLSPRGRHDRVQVPVFNVGGWFDIFLGGTIENYRSIPGSRLLIGPWAHGSAFGPYPDHAFKEFGDDAKIDLAELQLAFFRQHLAGREATDEAPVRLFVMGENRWRDEPAWPLARAEAEGWYLQTDGRLSQATPGRDDEPDEFDYDPRDPAPTIGGPTSLPGRFLRTNAGPLDQRPIEKRSDVLVFTSEPLSGPLEVTGPLELVLHAATSAVDTDWIGKLCDVDRDGTSRILAEGVLRARFRDGYEAQSLLEPDRPYEYEIDLGATCNVFQPGHSIRLLVTSSSFPRLDRNAGSGLPLGEDTEETLRPAHQRVFHDARRPSHLRLPVVPR